MASRAERSRLRKARTIAAAAKARETAPARSAQAAPGAPAAARAIRSSRTPKREAREDVIDLLRDRGRLTGAQTMAARHYGMLWRTAQIGGEAAIRVADLQAVRGGGSVGYLDGVSLEMLQSAEWIADCKGRLARAHQALAWHQEMIAVLDLICGRGVRPREITTDQRQSEQIETTLRLALDIVGRCLRGERGSAPEMAAA